MEAPSEAQLPRRTGGWITFPFIIASSVGLALAFVGWTSNLIVYLIKEFDVESIDAAQISNLVNGAGSLIPVVAAIVADSYLGCFSTIWISSIISLLGTILLALTATVDSLRPKSCEVGSTSCTPKPKVQSVVLYAAIVLSTLGSGGTRSTLATIGAGQLADKPKDQGIFFNWFFFFWYSASVIALTAIVYVEDNVSWKAGFFICVAANVLGSAIFLMGSRFYAKFKPKGSPFTSLARVIVASITNRQISLPSTAEDFFQGCNVVPKALAVVPSNTFRDVLPHVTGKLIYLVTSNKFLNRAAIISEGDVKPDGLTTNRWRLCSVQEVEDFKPLIKILPLWSTSFFLGTTIGVQASLSILQALAMNRYVGPNFQIPAGSILVFVLLSTALFLAPFDKFLLPTWKNLTGKSLTPLQRIGTGHVLNFLSMGVSALVESKRLNVAKSNEGSNIVAMSVLWLVPQLVIVGIAEAFHFPGQVSLYYQEFPITLKNMATAMISVLVGISFYLATALIDIVRRTCYQLHHRHNYQEKPEAGSHSPSLQEFDVESIDAVQISNLVNGAGSLIPVVAAIIADSFLGCFSTIWISSIISLLGTLLLALTATVDSLRPKPCEVGSTSCTPKPKVQYVVLYAAIVLATLGSGGTRSTLSTIGADQLADKPKDQGIFFNWFFFFWYSASVIASTAIVYVEDNISWKAGFFICVAANVLGSAIFLMGNRFYAKFKPKGSPFTSLARVIVASITKRQVALPSTAEDFFQGCNVVPKALAVVPSKTFSLSILQALAMDLHIGPNFQIPAGSVFVFVLISTALFLALFDKFVLPTWKNLTGKSLTPLQRIGIGHVLNFVSMGVSALVESKRLNVAKSNEGSNIVAMSVLWLVPQLALNGIAEAFHYPGQVSLYYQEFPITLKNMATAMISVILAISFYLATALIDVVRKTSTWLPGNINNGRLDNVYWILVIGGVVNFGYYVTCAWYYKYQNLNEVDHIDSPSDE
ncbi:hypothetical protein KY284_028239 [Solanum tuberosum]|nr:hypothetical protein KY284_028239 [Solanum tuberosum]